MAWFTFFIGKPAEESRKPVLPLPRETIHAAEMRIQPREGNIGEASWSINHERITFKGLDEVTSVKIRIPGAELVEYDALDCRPFEFIDSCINQGVRLIGRSDDQISLTLQRISREQLMDVIMDIRAQRLETHKRTFEEFMDRHAEILIIMAMRGAVTEVPLLSEPPPHLSLSIEFKMPPPLLSNRKKHPQEKFILLEQKRTP